MKTLTILSPGESVCNGYLLVEPSNMDDETFAEALPMLNCTPSMLNQSEQLMPRLIDVAALSSAQQESLSEVLLRELDGQRPPVICAWLTCTLNIEALSRHVARFLVGPGMDGASVVWRYFDPRVFSLAVTLFSSDQIHALLGPVVEWRFPWRSRWWSVFGPGQEADPLLGVTPAWPSANQWLSLQDSALIASVLIRLQDMQDTGDITDDTCLHLQRKITGSLLDARQRWHLSDKDELMEYALHCARYGKEFELYPKLAPAWSGLARGQTSWTELISILDRNDYRLLDDYSQSKLYQEEIKNVRL